MADFCKQCAEELGLRNDLEYLQTRLDTKEGLSTLVRCEGCGPIQVDHTGKCISEDCLRDHNPKEKEYDFDNPTKPELPIEDYEDDSTSWEDGIDKID